MFSTAHLTLILYVGGTIALIYWARTNRIPERLSYYALCRSTARLKYDKYRRAFISGTVI